MPHPMKVYGHLTAPLQFERWCRLYLATSLERSGVYNVDDRRKWATRATQKIMRKFQINSYPHLED